MARLDAELVNRGIARSRERAKEMIKGEKVTVNGVTALKVSGEVTDKDIIESSEEEIYVGRGALKLERAVSVFNIDLKGLVCLDVGASTGGFTDFMLKSGAKKVFAVDVGHGQLARSLCLDSRVVNMEGTDIRSAEGDIFGGSVDFAAIDVSFISLKLVISKVAGFLCDGGYIIALIKPQFESGREYIGKNGVVKDRKVHFRVLEELDSFFEKEGLTAAGYTFSPVTGGSGNIEYLVKLVKNGNEHRDFCDFGLLVETAFRQLKGG